MWLFAWTAKRDEAHVKRRQHEMPGSTTLRQRVHHEPTSQTKANPDHRPHTEALCCVSNSLETGLWTGHVGYGAHSPDSKHSREYPLDRLTLWGKRGDIASQLIADW